MDAPRKRESGYGALVKLPLEAMQTAGVGRELATAVDVDWPVHGLRHPPKSDTSGWYLWTGELTEKADFFLPMHPIHLLDRVPGLVQELSAPPGSRFLIAPGHRDAWYDGRLLDAP